MYDSAPDSGSPPTTAFNVLGPLAVIVDGAAVRLGGPRQVAVLGRLVLSPGHVVSMDQLVDSVWDGDAPKRPEVAVRSYVSNLRRSIEPDRDPGDRRSCIENSSPGYRLNVDRSQVDAYRFESLLSAGQAALAAGEPASAMVQFDEAQNLWRGEVCEGMVESDALLAYRSRLSELRLAMIELSSTARLELGELEGVIADVEAAIALHPLRERLSELAMMALYRAGRQSDALAVCRQLRGRLLESLGVTPGRPIEELEHRILTHDPSLLQRGARDEPGVGAGAATDEHQTGERNVGSPLVAGPGGDGDEGEPPARWPNGTVARPTGGVFGHATDPGVPRRPKRTDVADDALIQTSQGPEVDQPLSPSDGGRFAGEIEQHTDVGVDADGRLASTGIVGRDEQLATLRNVARDLVAGRGHTVVVTGESGIGKTALVEEFARSGIGANVVWGRCRPIASSLALWPWGQILDGLALIADADLRQRIETVALMPPDSSHLSDASSVGCDESERRLRRVRNGAVGDDAELDVVASPHEDQHDGASLFRPIVDVLRQQSSVAPLVVVVDDAQWADPSSIELLTFAGTSLADCAIAFIVVWREPHPGGPAAGLRALGRPPNVVRIPVPPLDRVAVEDLLERRGIGGGTLAARILTETAGNASFISELIADIGGAGETSNMDPTGGVAVALRPTAALRDRVLDRLEAVDAEAEAILTVAAIHGTGFTGDVLAEIVELPSTRVDEALERLVGAGLVIGETGAIGYRFMHPIVAKALVGKLSSPRRARLHSAVGHALWRRGAPEVVLARHFSKAGSAGTSLLAARFALTAARDHVALDDLFELEEIVRSGLEAMTGVDRSDVLAAELGLFLCQIARIRGQRSELKRLAADSTRAAALADDPRLVAAAALATTGDGVDSPAFAAAAWAGVALDYAPGARRKLAELLGEQGPQNPLSLALAVRVARFPSEPDDQWSALDASDMASLSTVRSPDDTSHGGGHPDHDETADVLAHIELARLVLACGSAEPAGALAARFGLDWHAVDRGRMATILDQRLDVERTTRQRGHERLLASRLRLFDGFDRRDAAAIDAVVDELSALPAPGSTPEALELDRLALEVAALLPLGELGQVERRIARARSRCQRVGIDPVAFDRQLLVLRWVQGKLDALDGVADGRSAQLHVVDELVVRALAAVGRGDVEPARDLLDELVALPAWGSLLTDPADAGIVGLVAIAASQAGDEQTCSAVFDKLSAWTERTVTLWGGLVALGPGSLLAGVAAAASGERATATELLVDSERRCRAVGARAWLRQTLVAQAGLAAASGDRAAADRLWAESVDLATEMVTGRRDLEPNR